MAAAPRSDTVLEGEVLPYHCCARCVRQSWLCGCDPKTGRDFGHRRDWIEAFATRLAGLLAIDVGFFAVLVNHVHFVLRTRPDVVESWSDHEVARRYLILHRFIKSRDGASIEEPSQAEITLKALDPKKVDQMRRSLSHPSTFMGALCEHIAVRANREESRHGHFWEERYRCRRLDTLSALLVCALYVDRNQIRAGEASTPEDSIYTSVYARIVARRMRQERRNNEWSPDAWLCPLSLDQRNDHWQLRDPGSPNGRRASDRGMVPVSLEKYLELLDWTGRVPREGKTGAIPDHLAPILERLEIAGEKWGKAVHQFDEIFGHVVGTSIRLAERAAAAGRRWYRGIAACREVFG